MVLDSLISYTHRCLMAFDADRKLVKERLFDDHFGNKLSENLLMAVNI